MAWIAEPIQDPEAMDWLHRAGVRVTCFYLAPSPYHPKFGMDENSR